MTTIKSQMSYLKRPPADLVPSLAAEVESAESVAGRDDS
jgi:hypothetical protein